MPSAGTPLQDRPRGRSPISSQCAISRIWRAFGLKPHRHIAVFSSPPTHKSADESRRRPDGTGRLL